MRIGWMDCSEVGSDGSGRHALQASHYAISISFTSFTWSLVAPRPPASRVTLTLVGLSRFELLTPRLSSVCSNQLSYRPKGGAEVGSLRDHGPRAVSGSVDYQRT